MSDLRFPYRWIADRRLNGLSDGAFRGFVNSFVWSVEQRTDGMIQADDVQLIPRLRQEHIDEFVRREVWLSTGPDMWLIVDYVGTQTTRAEFEVLENARRTDREKKARLRAKKKAEEQMSPGTVPGTNRGTAQDRTGKAGKDESRASGVTWEVASIPADPATGEVAGEVW